MGVLSLFLVFYAKTPPEMIINATPEKYNNLPETEVQNQEFWKSIMTRCNTKSPGT